jgi:hypothetical protein
MICKRCYDRPARHRVKSELIDMPVCSKCATTAILVAQKTNWIVSIYPLDNVVSSAKDIEDMAEYLDSQGVLNFCRCGHEYNCHSHPRIVYGDDCFEEERWNLRCNECPCSDFRPKECEDNVG